ncbi:MAG TPA: hypothetical protein VGD40_23055 [Chryseosolibacter sp.]
MNIIIRYLESKNAVFHGALILMALYVPHAGALFVDLEHIDMSFAGYNVLNWFYGVALAAVIEFLILIFIINGYRSTGKFYAIVCFFLNVFYYDYWFVSFQDPTINNLKVTVISLFICLTHSLSVWQLSELFFKRLKDEREDLFCEDCDAGPFPSKRSLDGHVSRVHKTNVKRVSEALLRKS